MSLHVPRLGLAAAALISLALPMAASADRLTDMLAIERARPVAPLLSRETLLQRPVVEGATISPDGHQVAYLRVVGEQRSLWLQPTAPAAAAVRLVPRTDARDLMWSPDGQWLFLVGPHEIQMLSTRGMPGGGRIAELGGSAKARLLGFDPWHAAVLLLDRTDRYWRVWRVGAGGHRQLIAYSSNEPIDVAIYRDGRIAFAKIAEGDRHILLHRDARGVRRVGLCLRMARCDLLGVTPDGANAYFAADGEGGRRALFLLNADGGRRLLHADPAGEVDLDAVVFDRGTGRPLFAAYRGATPMRYALATEARSPVASLDPLMDTTIETAVGLWLARERDARLQGYRWRLLDPKTGATRLLLDDHPGRPTPALLSPILALDYTASDGMHLHGLLSVPPGRDVARLPLVTIAHGGPWSHDAPDYSALTQLLTNRGYIVFRPQFRGSTGYGRDYMLAAGTDFGNGRVQRDIEEGTRYLLARGIGDPGRTAIMGASFGGYSTLQALSNGSQLYRLGIAIVPPIDFGWVSRHVATRSDFGRSQGMSFATILSMLGMDITDEGLAQRLSAQSPGARIGSMRTPLLLLASGRDERVPIRSVIDYAARLRQAKAPVRIVVARNQPHAPTDPNATAATLFLVEDALSRAFTGKATRPSPQLEDWMRSKSDSL